MSIKFILILCVFTLASPLLAQHTSKKIKWNVNEEDGITWAMNCEFVGNHLNTVKDIEGQYCGMLCASTLECTHFVWMRKSGGTCELKKGSISLEQAKWKRQRGIVCGIVPQEEDDDE